MSIDHVRPELTTPSTFGTQPDVSDLIELRGGRFLPTVEESRSELATLLHYVELKYRPHTLEVDDVLPTPQHMAQISFSLELGCWQLPTYSGTRGGGAYGRLFLKGLDERNTLAHRTMYEVFFGPDSLPGGKDDFLDHICEHKGCCYPRHLERTTHRENTRRGRVRSTADQVQLDL